MFCLFGVVLPVEGCVLESLTQEALHTTKSVSEISILHVHVPFCWICPLSSLCSSTLATSYLDLGTLLNVGVALGFIDHHLELFVYAKN